MSKNNLVSKRTLLLATFVLIMIIIAVVFLQNKRSQSPAQSGPTVAEKKIDDELNAAKKKDQIENESTQSQENSNKNIDLTARQETNGSVTVFTKLYGYSEGSCELEVKNNDLTNIQTAPVIYQSDFSSCAGFSVPINDLGTGNWSLTLKIDSQDSTQSKNISFEVKR